MGVHFTAAAAGLIVFLASGPAMAQLAPVKELAKIESGSFVLDKSHARIVFSTTHLGFSTYYGFFGDFDAKLQYDAKAPAKSTLDVTVSLNGLVTNDAKLDEALKGAEYFDVAQFPTATFKATKIEVSGAAKGKITGDLTLHGVTKPVTLDAAFHGGGPHPVTQDYVIGFDATGVLKRSDFGIKTLVPFVGDEVKLVLSCEFDRVPKAQ